VQQMQRSLFEVGEIEQAALLLETAKLGERVLGKAEERRGVFVNVLAQARMPFKLRRNRGHRGCVWLTRLRRLRFKELHPCAPGKAAAVEVPLAVLEYLQIRFCAAAVVTSCADLSNCGFDGSAQRGIHMCPVVEATL
jgi:hypothetical protein